MEEPTKIKLSKEQRRELYVNPDEFWEEIRIYYEDKSNKFPLKLAYMVEKIATKMRWMHIFSGYHYVDEMVSDAKEKMLEVLLEKKFNLYAYTKLEPDQYQKKGKMYSMVMNYKRGTDMRGNGGENERGRIIFLDGFKEIDNTCERIVYKKDEFIYDPSDLKTPILELTDKNLESMRGFTGPCLQTKNIAFGYFSQTCKNCYIARIKKEKHQEDIKDSLRDKEWGEAHSRGDGWNNVKIPKGSDFDDEYF